MKQNIFSDWLQHSKMAWLWRNVRRELWLRSILYSVIGIATALAALLLKPYVPDELADTIGSDAVDSILNILAASMLSVTIFSLSTMASAFSSATSNVTPRAVRLLIDDTSWQNALATFVGTFLFSIVGIIALNTGLYGAKGRVVLFIVTQFIIAVIIMTLLRWINEVPKLGRVTNTMQRVEKAVTTAMQARKKRPFLGGTTWSGNADDLSETCHAIHAHATGYVQHIDTDALSSLVNKHECQLFVQVLPGDFVTELGVLAHINQPADEDVIKKVQSHITIKDIRSFDHDPRFGISVMAEVASRALSPAVNDPATAIEVIGRMVRILSLWSKHDAEQANISYPHVYVRDVSLKDMFADAFEPIARDGAGLLEIQTRLQKALHSLAALPDARYTHAAKHMAKRSLAHATHALPLEADKQRMAELAAWAHDD